MEKALPASTGPQFVPDVVCVCVRIYVGVSPMMVVGRWPFYNPRREVSSVGF